MENELKILRMELKNREGNFNRVFSKFNPLVVTTSSRRSTSPVKQRVVTSRQSNNASPTRTNRTRTSVPEIKPKQMDLERPVLPQLVPQKRGKSSRSRRSNNTSLIFYKNSDSYEKANNIVVQS